MYEKQKGEYMLVTIFYYIDEFCKIFEEELRKTSLSDGNIKIGGSGMSLSEIMTICIYFHYSGYKDFKSYYKKHVVVHMKSDFRKLVSYNRFVELKNATVLPLALFMKLCCHNKCTGVSFIDSFALQVCNNRRIYSHKVFRDIAQRGVTSMGFFYGFKVHFIINHNGEIINFNITPGNIADNNAELLEKMTQNLFGKLIGDKGYMVNPNLFQKLYQKGIHLVTKIRKNMTNKLMPMIDKLLLRKRGTIESAIGILKEGFSIEHSRHRSPVNFLSHVFSSLVAYFFKPDKPSVAHPKRLVSI